MLKCYWSLKNLVAEILFPNTFYNTLCWHCLQTSGWEEKPCITVQIKIQVLNTVVGWKYESIKEDLITF